MSADDADDRMRRLADGLGRTITASIADSPCHACGEPIGLDLALEAVAGHSIRYTVHPLTPGAMMTARAIGGQLTALAKLNESVAATQGLKVQSLLTGIEMGADGQISFDLMLASIRKPPAKSGPDDQRGSSEPAPHGNSGKPPS